MSGVKKRYSRPYLQGSLRTDTPRSCRNGPRVGATRAPFHPSLVTALVIWTYALLLGRQCVQPRGDARGISDQPGVVDALANTLMSPRRSQVPVAYGSGRGPFGVSLITITPSRRSRNCSSASGFGLYYQVAVEAVREGVDHLDVADLSARTEWKHPIPTMVRTHVRSGAGTRLLLI